MARFQARIACGNPLFVSTFLSLLVFFSASAPSRAGVIIDEIMQNPAAVSDTSGEWFELFNPDALAVDLFNWRIADLGSNAHVIGSHLSIPANGYAVLGRSAAGNGGVAVDYTYGSDISLGNGADELLLFDAADVEIDRVEWDGGPAFPDPTGASMALLDPALDNNVGANWITSTTAYGDGDLGTPGALNFAAVSQPDPPVSMGLPDTLWLVLPLTLVLIGWRGKSDKGYKSQVAGPKSGGNPNHMACGW